MTDTLRTDFDPFLFAPVVEDANGVQLTVLSVLARRGVDPWIEAAALADLPKESAVQKLVAMLAGVPNGPAPGADTKTLAERLVGLLHRSRKHAAPAAVESIAPAADSNTDVAADADADPDSDATQSSRRYLRWGTYILFALICLAFFRWAMTGN